MYNLKSSMSDRMDFDSMARQCGYDSADALEADFLVNIPKSDVEEMAESAFVAGEQFQDDDREEPGYVEDMEEAHARFVGKWVEGFLLRQKENHTEEIKNALVDEGLLSLFGKYAAQLNMSVGECIQSLAGDWEGEEDGLLRSVREGDLKAMLVEEVPRMRWQRALQGSRMGYVGGTYHPMEGEEYHEPMEWFMRVKPCPYVVLREVA